MNPRSVSRFPIASDRLRGAAAGSVLLYVETAPHIATRPPWRRLAIAASRWSPPTLSK